MKQTFRTIKFLQFTLAFLVIFSACSRKQSQVKTETVFSEAIAKEISYITNGNIQFDEAIKIVFNESVIPEEEVNTVIDGVFNFNPSINGKAVWISRNELQFTPNEHLPLRTSYTATLNLQKLAQRFKDENIEDLVFDFFVVGRDISSFSGSLELLDREDPRLLNYSGTLSFTVKTDLQSVEKAVQIKGKQRISLTWSTINEKTLRFVSSEIIRSDNNEEYTLTISRKPLDLEHDFTESFTVTPLKKMAPNEIITDENGRTPKVRILFSDEIDIDQNIEGLISVEPSVKITTKKLGNAVILDGSFRYGEQYDININKGIRSRWGTVTETNTTHKVKFSNIQPQIEFASNGIVLPSSNNKKIQFYTANLKRIHLEVKKVSTNHIGQFIRSEQLTSTSTRNSSFSNSYARSVGVIVKNQTIDIGGESNIWLLNEFDLSELFSKYDDGLFLIRINFTPEDISQSIETDVLGYIQEKGQIYKPVFISNLGITVKNTSNETVVFVTDILTGKPMPSANVSLLNYNGESFSRIQTNKDGRAVFRGNRYFRYITAEEGKQITALNRNEMRWSNSGFDIGGVSSSQKGTRGFIYTERGVYRPGDSIYVSFIARNHDNTFPANHSVRINVKDPQYKTIYEHTSIQSTDGFYVFGFNTEENSPTGNYNISINAGGSWFNKELKIETVVAEELRVTIRPAKKQFLWTDNNIEFDIIANYLFGASASELKAEAVIEIHPHQMTFPKYTNYFFSRADIDYKPFTQNIISSNLDKEGKLTVSWPIPALGKVPSGLKAKLIGKVLDKGGQPNEGWNAADIHIYPAYVGIMDPSGYGYFKTGQEVKFPVVLLDINGEKLTGKSLTYRIYQNNKRWWYQYNNRRNYQLKYKEDSQTSLVKEAKITINEGISYISYTPHDNGEYLIEISDGGRGHTASMFFSSYQYGSIPGGDLNEGTLTLRSDKDKYSSNETAKILLPNPKHGNVLVTIEKGKEIINWFWVDPTSESSDELTINIPLSKEMLPNVYATVSVLQPHSQTINDRPIRMFGIIPIMVEDSDTKIPFTIDAPSVLNPNEEFKVRINTNNRKSAQFTIAVVDEGLLSLTQYKTPSPWQEFFKKIGLFVETYDIFSHVISANKGDVFQTFSIGGADDMDYRESQLDPTDGPKRFEPVSMFKGVVKTNDQGFASVKFTMPDYIGAVRIMVVGANMGSYGSAEKSIPVRSEIIMQPSIPRVLNPGDEFILPVALFNMNTDIKNAKFTIKTEGPIEVVGERMFNVDFSKTNETDIRFKVKVKETIGQAKIIIEGESGKNQFVNETNIRVIPTSPRIYDQKTEKIEKEKTITMNVPAIGIKGTNMTSLNISVFPNMNFNHRLKWLINYPYGCIEQLTSAVFPQLSLKKMGYFETEEIKEIDYNINEGINRLNGYMLSGGGFTYWPGLTEESEWGTNYATHFLVEAKKAGYSVPDYMYNNAINKLKSAARRHNGNITTRVNRTFILALAEQQQMSEMNMLMENDISEMNNADKWMLAASYFLSGAENIGEQILNQAGTTTSEYEPFSYNFGSADRDNAIILYCATLMKKSETAELIAKSISKKLSGRDYLSTQSSGYMLLALGKYFESIGLSLASGQVISGNVAFADGKKIEFNQHGKINIPVKNNFNKKIQINLSSSSNVDQAYASLSWSGVPLKDESKSIEKNLGLKVNWYDQNGNTINPASLKQGDTFYGRFTVTNTSPINNVSEVALMQIIPSGWQIENVRLNNTLLPDWTQRWNLNKENYSDIRDDRVMWFFDLNDAQPLDFIVKINCVSAGDFWLPGTLVEAMYNNDYKATTEGRKVHVKSFK